MILRAMSSLKGILPLVIFGTLIFMGTLSTFPKQANAILVLGHYVFIGPDAGAQTYKIKNITKEQKGYRIEWTQLRQVPVGPKQKVAPGEYIPGVMDAEPYMYVAPRRLLMRPDQLQNIRFMVRRQADMQPGEYRSYIYLQPEKLPKAFTGADDMKNRAGNNSSASLSILTGYRIPVIFLHGETTLKPGVKDIHFGTNEKGVGGLHFTFTREGTRSAIGDMHIYCDNSAGRQKVMTMEVKVFTEISEKKYFKPFQFPEQGCSTLTAEFLPHSGDPDFPKGPVQLASVPIQ